MAGGCYSLIGAINVCAPQRVLPILVFNNYKDKSIKKETGRAPRALSNISGRAVSSEQALKFSTIIDMPFI